MARILHVCTSDDFVRFLSDLLLALVAAGHDVHLATRLGPRARALGPAGVHLHAVPLTRRMTPFEDLVAVARLRETVARVAPDVLHVHNPKGALLGLVAARGASQALRLYTVHGLVWEKARGLRGSLLRAAERTCCALSDDVICVSGSVLEQLRTHRILSQNQGRVIADGSATGVDVARFRPDAGLRSHVRRRWGIPSDARVVAFVGRLHRDKGLDALGRMWPRIARAAADAHLIVAGGLDAVAPADLSSFDGRSDAHFLGPLEDSREVFAAADLHVLPSEREGFPTVVLEAAASEVPTVAWDVTGSRDAVRPASGRLVPFADETAFVAAVLGLLGAPEDSRGLGQSARRWVSERFGSTQVLRGILRHYEALGVTPPPATSQSRGGPVGSRP